MKNSLIPQHKRLATGQSVGFKKGGYVSPSNNLKTGIPDTPLTKAKINNGIPGMKKGGSCGCGS